MATKPQVTPAGEESNRPAALAPGLHVAATPIGNLGDLTHRAEAALRAADIVLCEDTRVSARLLARYGIRATLWPYHEHNAARQRPRILERLAAGAAIVLISDAGTPLVSDPGYRLVREALAGGHAVTALPGPSAVLAALSIAGLPTDRFLFAGFLDAKASGRRKALAELAGLRATLIFLESAGRLPALLSDMAELLGGEREAAVARELTKLHEEVRRGRLAELAAHYGREGPPRGEIVVLAGPPPAEAPDAAALDSDLREALRVKPLKEAVAEVASRSGLPRRQVYARALVLKDTDEPDAPETD
ncbi:MAG: 16S rRNA (cytidine(1402)-2'-O)-methyltransferase [Alphaproteobacteria bacterium]|nr:16S rRNA (cytidine(1402)-2'-O)-methyltransferase [Alphaproteobacteria bacterium]